MHTVENMLDFKLLSRCRVI